MMETSENPRPRGRPIGRRDLRVHELDGEGLIFDPVSCDTHRLNETALFIWRHCDGRHDAACIADRLTGAYDVTPQEAVEHVERTLGELEAADLILQAGEFNA
jgi:PqqD family protein of HPr-rel-A system